MVEYKNNSNKTFILNLWSQLHESFSPFNPIMKALLFNYKLTFLLSHIHIHPSLYLTIALITQYQSHVLLANRNFPNHLNDSSSNYLPLTINFLQLPSFLIPYFSILPLIHHNILIYIHPSTGHYLIS